jgi:DNA primase small subunit
MAELDWGSVQFVSEQFKRYYASGAQRVEAPPGIRQREFGFLSFGGRSMLRHIGFDDAQYLRRYLVDYAPAHSYFSSAYYDAPEAEMEHKGWLGADLVFDIDADHFDLPCKEDHDWWSCRTCGEEGAGRAPERCPGCGKATFNEESWLCEHCLEAAKYETQKLLDILVQDFGFTPSGELTVNFSGNRGYHVHVRSPPIRKMDQLARREIVDYIMGIGIKSEFQGFNPSMMGEGSILTRGGWRGRAIRALYDFVADANQEDIEDLKLGRAEVQTLLDNREEILGLLIERHHGGIIKYIDPQSIGKLMEAAVEKQAAAIDTVVTTDLHRLIRLPNTLHGKSGWLTQRVPIDDLTDYDPLTSAIAFTEGTVKVHIRGAPKLSIAGETYGPFEDEVAELPKAVSMFLLCRRVARVER